MLYNPERRFTVDSSEIKALSIHFHPKKCRVHCFVNGPLRVHVIFYSNFKMFH